MSRFGDFCVHDDNDNDNMTNYFIPYACTWGNKERKGSITLACAYGCNYTHNLACEKYHTFFYSYVRVVKVENRVLYDIG